MADRFVVDTSVFLRWYVPQIGFEHAREVREDFLAGAVGQELIVGAGSRDRVTVRPDRVFRHAVRLSAHGIVFSHNHLDDTGPSQADRAVTRRLVAAGHLLGVPLVASLVIEPNATHDLVSDRTWRS